MQHRAPKDPKDSRHRPEEGRDRKHNKPESRGHGKPLIEDTPLIREYRRSESTKTRQKDQRETQQETPPRTRHRSPDRSQNSTLIDNHRPRLPGPSKVMNLMRGTMVNLGGADLITNKTSFSEFGKHQFTIPADFVEMQRRRVSFTRGSELTIDLHFTVAGSALVTIPTVKPVTTDIKYPPVSTKLEGSIITPPEPLATNGTQNNDTAVSEAKVTLSPLAVPISSVPVIYFTVMINGNPTKFGALIGLVPYTSNTPINGSIEYRFNGSYSTVIAAPAGMVHNIAMGWKIEGENVNAKVALISSPNTDFSYLRYHVTGTVFPLNG